MNNWNFKDLEGKPWSGASKWCDEIKGSKLTGVSTSSFTKDDNSEARYSINCWLGPGLMIPHMLLTIGYSNGKYFVETDYTPRGPGPFGSDRTYMQTFYGHEITGNGISYRQSYTLLPPKLSFYSRLLQSPAYFGATNLSENIMTDLATTHVDRWLSWVSTATPLEARQKASYNARDDKIRQFAFAANLYDYSNLFGQEIGQRLAVACTGPLAEAYVGGGS